MAGIEAAPSVMASGTGDGGNRGLIVMLPPNRRGRPLETGARADGNRGIAGIVEGFESLGYRVDFADLNRWPWNPLALLHPVFKSIDLVRALRVLLRRRNAKAVISYFESGSLVILALRRLLGFKARVVIVDIGVGTQWRVRERILRFCIARADAIFTFARGQADDIVKNYRPDAVVEFLPQQTDTEFYRPDSAKEGDFVLSVGGDVSRDYATLMAALAGVPVPMVVRTSLLSEDPSSRPNLSVIREQLGDRELRDLYQRAKLVVLPLHDTLHPGGITTLLEAFACGKAVVVSDSRGVRDYLHHEENCLTVPCNDADALRNAILRLASDGELRALLGRNARAYAERELSQAVHVRRLAAAFAALPEDPAN